MIEITAGFGCGVAGKPLRRLGLPKGTLIAAIVRGEDAVVPRGDDTIQSGDRVIVMATAEARPSIERLFRGRRKG